MQYKYGEEVPNDVLCNRLKELSDAVTKGRDGINREFYMSVPVRFDKDADMVLSIAAKRLTNANKLNELISQKFKSGNCVDVERIMITRQELDELGV